MPDTAPTVDPALVADDENAELAHLLYSGLVRLDSSYRIVPDAAARIAVARDHRTYTFYLRKDLRFSNGDPVTAYDFEFSIKRSLNPALKSPSAPWYLIDIDGASAVLAGKTKKLSGVKVLNPYTLQISARWPVPYFLMELTYPTSYALDKKRIAKFGTGDASWFSNPIGSGPYRLKSWQPNSKMVLVPNKHYRASPPSLKQVTISLTTLPSTDLYQYVSHSLDVVTLPSNDATLLRQPNIQETNMLGITGMYMNLKAKPFQSAKVRWALTLAINRPQLVARALGQTVTPFAGYVPPGEAGYFGQLKVLPYDVAAARQALKSAGFPSGKNFPTLTLYYASDPALSRLAQICAKAWHKNLNISVDTQALDPSALVTRAEENALPLYISGWSASYPDPHDWLTLQWRSDVPNNDVHFQDRAFDNLVKTADVTWDSAQRTKLYNQAQQILVNDAAWIPLYIPHRVVFIRRDVTNLVLTGYGIIPKGGSWAQVGFQAPPSKSHRAF